MSTRFTRQLDDRLMTWPRSTPHTGAMGFVKDVKVNKISGEAQRAIQEGRSVFLCRINVGMTDAGASGTVAGGAAEIIEGIEALGWRLDQMSYTTDKKGAPEGYYLFRRAHQPAPHQAAPQQGYYQSNGYHHPQR